MRKIALTLYVLTLLHSHGFAKALEYKYGPPFVHIVVPGILGTGMAFTAAGLMVYVC